MTSNDRTPTQEVLEMNTINFSGDMMPRSWFQHLRKQTKKASAKPYAIAIMLLADIVYWYRPSETRDQSGQTVELRRKFAHGQWLQRSYGQYMDSHGFSKPQIRDALRYLESKGLIELIFKSLDLPGHKRTLQNVMYIRIFPKRIREITHSPIYKNSTPPIQKSDPTPTQISDTNTETTTKNTTDKKTSGEKAPEQPPTPSPANLTPFQIASLPSGMGLIYRQPPTQPPPPESSTPSELFPIQEAVAPKEPDESLTTRIVVPCAVCTFVSRGSLVYRCYPEKCDCPCHSSPDDTHEGMVDESGIPVSDATRDALQDVIKTPVGLDDEPFTNLIATLDSALAADDVSDKVKRIFREARDKLIPVGKSGINDPPDVGFPSPDSAHRGLTDVAKLAFSPIVHPCVLTDGLQSYEETPDGNRSVYIVPAPGDAFGPLDDEHAGFVDREPPDDDPKYEAPLKSVNPVPHSQGLLSNMSSGMVAASPIEILPNRMQVVTLPPTQPAASTAPAMVAAPVELTKKEIAALAFNLEAYFCEIAGLKTPNRSTAYFAKKAHIRWGNPCKEMMRLADYDLAKAKRFMDAAWAEVVKDNWEGKISTAQSIENYFGAQARDKTKAVAMPGSGALGLTEAQKKTGLFSRQKRNGAK